MSAEFDLELLTPMAPFFKGRATSVIFPAFEGYAGILHNHAPFICQLRAGVIEVKAENKTETYYVSGGFLECNKNKVTVLADSVETQQTASAEKVKSEIDKLSGGKLTPEVQEKLARLRELQKFLNRPKAQ